MQDLTYSCLNSIFIAWNETLFTLVKQEHAYPSCTIVGLPFERNETKSSKSIKVNVNVNVQIQKIVLKQNQSCTENSFSLYSEAVTKSSDKVYPKKLS